MKVLVLSPVNYGIILSMSTNNKIPINLIKDEETIFALKHLCEYLVSFGWEHQLDSDEWGAELNLAVARSKRHAVDVTTLANLDDELSWGTVREHIGKDLQVIKSKGDFSPWYQGNLTLEELLDSVSGLVEILDSTTPKSIRDVDFIHYYNYLYSKIPMNYPKQTTIVFNSLHPKIQSACKSLYSTSHFAQAILEAYKVVFNEIKDITNIRNLDGKKLAEKAFAIDNPIVMLNPLVTESEQDEQKGFMLLLSGAAVGIRNPKAHDLVTQTDKYRTLEYLSFASLLLTRIDERASINLNVSSSNETTRTQQANTKNRITEDLPYVYLQASFGGNGHMLDVRGCTTYNLSDSFVFLEKIKVLGAEIKFNNTLIKAGESISHTGIEGLAYPKTGQKQHVEIYYHSKNKSSFVARQNLRLEKRNGDEQFNIVGLDDPEVTRL